MFSSTNTTTTPSRAQPAPPPPSTLDVNDAEFAKDRANLEQTLEHTFANPALLREALVGERKPVHINGRAIEKGNQRIAVLGDSVLKIMHWTTKFWDDESIGSASKKFEYDASNFNLAAVGRDMFIDSMIVCVDGSYMQHAGGVIVASTIEGIIGALWSDTNGNMEIMRRAVKNLLGEESC